MKYEYMIHMQNNCNMIADPYVKIRPMISTEFSAITVDIVIKLANNALHGMSKELGTEHHPRQLNEDLMLKLLVIFEMAIETDFTSKISYSINNHLR